MPRKEYSNPLWQRMRISIAHIVFRPQATSHPAALNALILLCHYLFSKLSINGLRLNDVSFAPANHFETLEIHKVFLLFPKYYLRQNPSSSALADLS